jgi:hypothetical protein
MMSFLGSITGYSRRDQQRHGLPGGMVTVLWIADLNDAKALLDELA